MFGKLSRLFASDSGQSSDESGPAQEFTSSAQAALGHWVTTELDGHNLNIFHPISDENPDGCVLFLHGHGRVMLDTNETFTKLFQAHNLTAVCPDGNRSWWMDRICSEFSPDITPQAWLLERMIPYIKETLRIESPNVALLGVSMGGQGALQLSFRHASQFPVVAAISPAIDFHQLYGQQLPLDEMYKDAEDARQATVVLNLHPLAWPRHQWFCCDPGDTDWFDGCVRLGMKLSSSGILHERDLETSAGGHSWDYFNHMASAAIQHIARALKTL